MDATPTATARTVRVGPKARRPLAGIVAARATHTITSGGPLVRRSFENDRAARAYVESCAPLKRGWTGRWVSALDGSCEVYVRTNSAGRDLRHYNITLRRTAEWRLS